MNLLHLAWRYLWSRAFVTVLTLTGIALGAGLICAVLTMRRESERAFMEDSASFDLVIGAKGSPLQLVLSSIYHLDVPTGNIAWEEFEKWKADPRVIAAYPIGLGDNFRGYRIVGTSKEFLSLENRDPRTTAKRRVLSIQEGREFDKAFEVVLGSEVARLEKLKPGDKFFGSHGLISVPGAEEHREFGYTVVGILNQTNSSFDRAIYTPLESVWNVHKKEAEEHDAMFADEKGDAAKDNSGDGKSWLMGYDPAAESKPEVTAILLQLELPGLRMMMVEEIKDNSNTMAAIPVMEMLRLYQKILAPMQKTLLAVAYLVVTVASLSILTTLYQAAERRRRDIAVMRCLGAHAVEIFAIVLIESVMLTALGVISGALIAHGFVAIAANTLRERTGLALNAWTIDQSELLALAVVLCLGFAAGLIPALLAYRRSPVNDLHAS